MTEQKSTARTVIGKVISNKMAKTIVVQIERLVKHPFYGKYIKRFSKMYAHDNENQCSIGDLVQIQESRPLSKTKNWMLVKILKQADKEGI